MGQIVTFYSYKGGVGRTFALANTASLLAAAGRRVLVVDWDLEAPGLDKFFSPYRAAPPWEQGGLLSLLEEQDNGSQGRSWSQFIRKVQLPFNATIDLLPSGYDLPGYQRRLLALDWEHFYQLGGGSFVEALRTEWLARYDFVFIDSRTGVTDSGGVCTIQLPDTIVLVFTATEQSLTGIVDIGERISVTRQQSSFARMEPTLIPLLSRWDGREEQDEGERWLRRIESAVSPFMQSWTSKAESCRRVIESLRVPHVAYFSFGEKLPVMTHSLTDPELPGRSFATLAALLVEHSWDNVEPVREALCEFAERDSGRRITLGHSNRGSIFVSMVSSEFRTYSELLVKDIVRGGIFVSRMEDFGVTATTTLEKLDSHIGNCEAVIHVVGEGLGSVPPAAAVDALLEKHTDFLDKLSIRGQTDLTRDMLRGFSYTQWEAYLSIFHNVRLHVYRADAQAPREPGFTASESESELQAEHLQRLWRPRQDRHIFNNEERLSAMVLADIDDILPGRDPIVQVTPSRLKHPTSRVLGRDAELTFLDRAWGDPRIQIVVVCGRGGEGKTSLVSSWMAELALKGWRGAERVLDWSFYSQGTEGLSASTADRFFNRLLTDLGDADYTSGSAELRAVRLAESLSMKRTLLVLDGLEPLLHPPGPMRGMLKDKGVATLLRTLAKSGKGLAIVTSREPLTDVREYYGHSVIELALGPLPPLAGAHVLYQAGVQRAGSAAISHDDPELQAASSELQGHALTLRLVGNYLRLTDDTGSGKGDVRQRHEMRLVDADREFQAAPNSPYGSAFKAFEAYEQWFAAGDDSARLQLSVLRLLGLFDGPASADHLAILRQPPIPGLTELWSGQSDRQWRIALNRLAETNLVEIGADGSLDAHPLLREYFSQRLRTQDSRAFRAAHGRLFEHLCQSTPHRPDTLDGLRPLYQAVVHGGLAERQQEAYDKVYVERILRGFGIDGHYSTRKLGAIGANLRALAAFFEQPWTQLSPNLSEADQAWVLNEAAFSLRALGRLTEALEPMRAGLGRFTEAMNWRSAAITASNISQLEITLGRTGPAVADARLAIDFADRSGDSYLRLALRSTAADALHQSSQPGEHAEARALFAAAGTLQREHQPQFDLLYSLQGFYYCDLVLTPAERAAWRAQCGAVAPTSLAAQAAASHSALAEAERRASRTLEWVTKGAQDLFSIALDHLTLARVALYRAALASQPPAADANPHLAPALDRFRMAGRTDELPRALLTAAHWHVLAGDDATAERHLAEAQQIAERGPMPLFLADVHLHRARLFWSREELAKAKTLVEKHAYGRRYEELADAEAAFAAREGPPRDTR